MKGSISKRCGCPPTYSARGERLACKLKHGSWSLRVGVRDPGTGKRRLVRESGFPTRAAAEARCAELADQVARGAVPARRSVTFGHYAADWLEARGRRVRPVSLISYAAVMTHATGAFGGLPLGDVTRRDVERMVGQPVDAGRSQRTASLTLFVVRSVLGQALDDGLVVRNVAAKVQAVGKPARDRGALPPDDMSTLRAYVAGDRLHACWLLTMYGLRRSEIMGLTWADVDLAAGTLTVDHGVVTDASGRRAAETPTKTRRGTRILPLPPDVLAALRELRDRQAAEHGFQHVRTGYLAVDELGEPYRPQRWSTLWRALCQAARVEPVTLHAARHSSVTAMRAAGVPDDVVAAWHGHDEVVMRRTYSHPDADALAAAGPALADALGERS